MEDLSLHLKILVSKQRSCSIPTNPSVFLPAQKAQLQLGTQAPDIVAMDADRLETSDEFKHQERHTRLDRGLFGVGVDIPICSLIQCYL